MNVNASVTVAPESDPVFRPFEDSDLNGLWLYDNEFPVTECKNDRERRGWWMGCNAEAEADYTEQPGYAEQRERSLI